MTRNLRDRVLRLLAVSTIVGGVLLPTAALAQDVGTYGNGTENTSGGGTGDQGVSGAVVEATDAGNDSLPFTGGDVLGLVAIGGVAVAGGTVLVRAGRRRSDARV